MSEIEKMTRKILEEGVLPRLPEGARAGFGVLFECALWEAYYKGVEDGRNGVIIETQEPSPYENEE